MGATRHKQQSRGTQTRTRKSSRRRNAHPKTNSVASHLVQYLEQLGVERVFGIPGGTISPFVDALLDTEIEHVTCQHESMAVYAASGEARVTGRPGVIAVTSGPGVLNALTGLAAAHQDQVPQLLLVGEVATGQQGRGALQDGSEGALDISSVVRTICKGSFVIRSTESAAQTLSNAIEVAMAIPPGPVVVRVPVDVASTELNAPLPPARLVRRRLPKQAALDEVAALLDADALLFLGGGVARARAWEEARILAERSGCAVATDLEAKGVFPESHPQSLGVFGVGGDGRAAAFLAKGPRAVVSVGARLDDTTTANFSPLLRPVDGMFVQIDEDPYRLGRSYRPDIAMHADIRMTLQGLDETLKKLTRPVRAAFNAPPFPRTETKAVGPVYDPMQAIAALQARFGEDTVFVSDIGNHLLFASQALCIDDPAHFHASIGLGGMGSGIGIAVGLQLAYGKSKRVVCICGDGCFLMHGNEVATCVRYGIPVTFVVIDDGQLGMVQHGDSRVYGRSHDWSLPMTDLQQHARALGARLDSVEQNRNSTIMAKTEGPTVIVVPIPANVNMMNPREATFYVSRSEEKEEGEYEQR